MNEIIKKYFIASNKFTPEMHLRQSGCFYSACGPFIKCKRQL